MAPVLTVGNAAQYGYTPQLWYDIDQNNMIVLYLYYIDCNGNYHDQNANPVRPNGRRYIGNPIQPNASQHANAPQHGLYGNAPQHVNAPQNGYYVEQHGNSAQRGYYVGRDRNAPQYANAPRRGYYSDDDGPGFSYSLSTNQDHRWREKPSPLPVPTNRDYFTVMKWLNTNKRVDRGKWDFEKTLYLNDDDIHSRIIHLFTCKDDSGAVLDQIVVKINGDKDRRRALAQAVAEYQTQLELRQSGRTPACVAACYAYALRDRGINCLIYGYLEYCPFGDLHDLVVNKQQGKCQIPEPFIWLAIQALAEAVFLLYTGTSWENRKRSRLTLTKHDLVENTRHGWKPMVNPDIKPLNVCLGKADTRYPAFKSVKMIDFGLCGEAPIRGYACGTPGFIPPEQTKEGYLDVEGCVANIVLIALRLMEFQRREYGEDATRDLAANFSKKYENVYSNQLVDLVRACLRNEPDHRPALTEVIYTTYERLEKYQQVNGTLEGLQLSEIDPRDRMEWRGDKFWIGGGRKSHLHRFGDVPHVEHGNSRLNLSQLPQIVRFPRHTVEPMPEIPDTESPPRQSRSLTPHPGVGQDWESGLGGIRAPGHGGKIGTPGGKQGAPGPGVGQDWKVGLGGIRAPAHGGKIGTPGGKQGAPGPGAQPPPPQGNIPAAGLRPAAPAQAQAPERIGPRVKHVKRKAPPPPAPERRETCAKRVKRTQQPQPPAPAAAPAAPAQAQAQAQPARRYPQRNRKAVDRYKP